MIGAHQGGSYGTGAHQGGVDRIGAHQDGADTHGLDWDLGKTEIQEVERTSTVLRTEARNT